MAQFLNTAKAYSEIENIITRAENQLVLISPYIQIPDLLWERLAHAIDKHCVNTTLVCRKDSLKRSEFKALKKLSRLDIYNLNNLHAKCFYNETAMVITSLNLYEHSCDNNREMGLLITLNEDREIFLDALAEAEFIIQISQLIKINKILAKEKQNRGNVTNVFKTDIGSSLKQSFPTFFKIFGFK